MPVLCSGSCFRVVLRIHSRPTTLSWIRYSLQSLIVHPIQLPVSRGGDAVENENAPHTFGVDEKKTIILLALYHRSILLTVGFRPDVSRYLYEAI